MQKSILWKGLSFDTEEHCAISYHDDKTIMIHGEIEGWSGNKALYFEYWLNLDAQWKVKSIEAVSRIADSEFQYNLKRDENGNWSNSQNEDLPEFKDCSYIDISLTPLTNTLPINGLKLTQQENHDIDVVYIDVIEHKVYRDRQNYTRIEKNMYRFENDDGSFTAFIEVDNDGFVTDYPDLFEMIKVK